jgi:hypothetical protein
MPDIKPQAPVNPELAYCEAGNHYTGIGDDFDPWHSDDSGDYCSPCWEIFSEVAMRTWGGSPSDATLRANVLSYSTVCDRCGVTIDEDFEEAACTYEPDIHYRPGSRDWEDPEDWQGSKLCLLCRQDQSGCGCPACDPPTPEWK